MYRNGMESYWEGTHTLVIQREDMGMLTIDVEALKIGKTVQIRAGKQQERVFVRVLYGLGETCTVYGTSEGLYVVREKKTCEERPLAPFVEKPVQAEDIDILQNGVGIQRFYANASLLGGIDPYLVEDGAIIPLDAPLASSFAKKVLAVLSVPKRQIVVRYEEKACALVIRVFSLNILRSMPSVAFALESEEMLSCAFGERKATVAYQDIPMLGEKRLFARKELSMPVEENMLSMFQLEGRKYYLYLKKDGLYLGVNNHYKATGYGTNLCFWKGSKHLYLVGRHHHGAERAKGKYDTLYKEGKKERLSVFKRPFGHTPIAGRYGYFKIRWDDLQANEKLHHLLYVGDEDGSVHNLKRRYRDGKNKTVRLKRNDGWVHVIRTNKWGNVISTAIPDSKEYTFSNRLKQKAAKWLARFTPKKANVFFEKKSEKADESGYRVFERVREKDPKGAHYFLLDERNEAYPKAKEKHGAHIVEKYSFRHYWLLFRAKRFFSSELSTHAVSDRLYLPDIQRHIRKTPLVFLQHGIMFAKPVDNPMAANFHKTNPHCRIEKCVISSPLEAKEFHKMGYTDEDLLLTGLATLDAATLAEGADKIAYMPTYRYWEESLVYQGCIEETSYYRSVMRVIRAFEKEGLLERLLIVPHNKFTAYICRHMPHYQHILSDNPSEALKQSAIFITDYSSAIYDATFRGAYPIFYWEEKEYLTERYKGIPPVNEENAPGVVVKDIDALLKAVKKAVQNEYRIPADIRQKYRAVNQFDDRKNTERILLALEEAKLL